MKTLSKLLFFIVGLPLLVSTLLADERYNLMSNNIYRGETKLNLVATPDNNIEITTDKPVDHYETAIKPGNNPVSRLVLKKDQFAENPMGFLKNPTGPLTAANCTVDFSDYDALGWLPGYAENTFAFSPWWFQECSGPIHVVVRPIGDDHFHLAYENPHIQPCNGDQTDWDIIHEDGTCEEVDPREMPRSFHPHLGSVTTHIYAHDGHDKQPFRLNTIRVENQQAIKLCYKPMQDEDGPWETSQPDNTTSPGIWFCFEQLTTGYWDLSAWTDYITEVKIVASDGGIYQLDDIGIWVY